MLLGVGVPDTHGDFKSEAAGSWREAALEKRIREPKYGNKYEDDTCSRRPKCPPPLEPAAAAGSGSST